MRDEDGNKLSISTAFYRTWGVFCIGMGWGIPVYSLYRVWQSYRTCTEEELSWDLDNSCAIVVRERQTKWYRAAGYIVLSVLAVLADKGITLRAELPPHQGELTLAEYVDNCNDYLEYRGYPPSVAADGTWYEPNAVGEWRGLAVALDLDDLPDVTVETNENGYVSAVTVTCEGQDGTFGHMARETAFYAFAASYERWGVIDLLRGGELEQTAWDHWDYGAPDTEQTNKTEMGALEITHEVAFSNATDEAWEQHAPMPYHSVYTIRKK